MGFNPWIFIMGESYFEWGFMMIINFNMISFLIMVLIFGLVGWFLFKKRGKNKVYLLIYGVFCLYLISVASVSIFPLAYFDNNAASNLWQSIDFIPLVGLFTKESLMNLVLLLPFGVVWPFVRVVPNALRMLPGILLPGLIIEGIQFLSGILSGGYTWWQISINDYLSYTLGIGLGYLIFRFAASLVLELFPMQTDDGTHYFREVCERSVPHTIIVEESDGGY
jgi:glycopeptide antibiotics resistance protein